MEFSTTDIQRLQAKICFDGLTKCWEWLAGTDKDGYGKFWINGETLRAHRVVFTMMFGKVPNGLCVCHVCDNPGCVNPAHLWAGTTNDNNVDKGEKNRAPFGINHGRHKLPVEKVRRIMELKAKGIGPSEIGRQVGLSVGHVSNVYYGKTWNRITGLPKPGYMRPMEVS
jgi:hypothetical protein